MRGRAVMTGDAIGVERSIFDGLEDGLLIDLHTHSFNALSGSAR